MRTHARRLPRAPCERRGRRGVASSSARSHLLSSAPTAWPPAVVALPSRARGVARGGSARAGGVPAGPAGVRTARRRLRVQQRTTPPAVDAACLTGHRRRRRERGPRGSKAPSAPRPVSRSGGRATSDAALVATGRRRRRAGCARFDAVPRARVRLARAATRRRCDRRRRRAATRAPRRATRRPPRRGARRRRSRRRVSHARPRGTDADLDAARTTAPRRDRRSVRRASASRSPRARRPGCADYAGHSSTWRAPRSEPRPRRAAASRRGGRARGRRAASDLENTAARERGARAAAGSDDAARSPPSSRGAAGINARAIDDDAASSHRSHRPRGGLASALPSSPGRVRDGRRRRVRGPRRRRSPPPGSRPACRTARDVQRGVARCACLRVGADPTPHSCALRQGAARAHRALNPPAPHRAVDRRLRTRSADAGAEAVTSGLAPRRARGRAHAHAAGGRCACAQRVAVPAGAAGRAARRRRDVAAFPRALRRCGPLRSSRARPPAARSSRVPRLRLRAFFDRYRRRAAIGRRPDASSALALHATAVDDEQRSQRCVRLGRPHRGLRRRRRSPSGCDRTSRQAARRRAGAGAAAHLLRRACAGRHRRPGGSTGGGARRGRAPTCDAWEELGELLRRSRADRSRRDALSERAAPGGREARRRRLDAGS